MTRLFQRGSSTSKIAENGWSQGETSIVLEANGGGVEDNHGKASVLILLSGVLKRGPSLQKSQQKADEKHYESSDTMLEDTSLRSLLGESNSFKNSLSQLPEVSSLSFPTNHYNSSSGLTMPAQNKRLLSSPLEKIIMLSFVSIFVLIAVLGSASPGYSSNAASSFIYNSYRRLQEDLSSIDLLLSGGIFGHGVLHPKKLMICPKDLEHHVPCYNSSSATESNDKSGMVSADRHCEQPHGDALCLVRPPRNYTLPLQWSNSIRKVWIWNTKLAENFESKTERIILDEDNLLTFETRETDGVEGRIQKIIQLLGTLDDTQFQKIGVRTVLDIGCGYGSLVASLLSRGVTAFCIAPYETQNSHVQVALDRGLPAMIGSLVTKQLPYPASSFNILHCADCGIDWSQKDGLLLLEIDRLLKSDGYFVWTLPMSSQERNLEDLDSDRKLGTINQAARNMCWISFPSQDRVYVWKKSANRTFSHRSISTLRICDDDENVNIVLYKRHRHCLNANKNVISLSQQQVASLVSGFLPKELADDPTAWLSIVKNYWSIITPLLFSDHPKRPTEDDPLPPPNIVRNVMDMNALYGSFNSALLEAGKSVWVMNVIPASVPNTLPAIYKRGLIGTFHDWCEAFPTYPRTYDLLHGVGLLSQQFKTGCSLSNLLLEMDRILRPQGWVLLRDRVELIEEARLAASQMRWEARTIDVEGNDNLRLLVCQKLFWKN